MAKHKPGSIWSFRHALPYDSYVRTANPQALEFVLAFTIPTEQNNGANGTVPFTTIRMPRREARLLARRILQCLEDTK
jgi:hypothetical protein